MILGIDAGNSGTKVCGSLGIKQFPSDLGEYRSLNLANQLQEDEMIYEYQGKKGFAGMLARRESEFVESRKGLTKAHDDAKLRILLAIHRYSDEIEHYIVVGQPISTHTRSEKQKIKEMLSGRHELTVNGIRKVFVVRRCEVGAEGAVVGLLNPVARKQRIIDIGSGTVNFGTVESMRFNDRESFTVEFGMNTIRKMDPEHFARMICIKAQTKWKEEDSVYVCGGGAELLLPYIKTFFPYAELILDPVTANARGFYQIGRRIYA